MGVLPKENQMNYYPEGKIPFVWIIDDANILVINSYRHRAPLYLERIKHSSKSALSFVNYIINSINQNIKVSFFICIDPQYERGGLSVLKDFDNSLMGNYLKELHQELQDWLRRYANNCKVVVHGWNHYNSDYLSDDSWNTMPGVDYNRRSEWYEHPDPVRLFGKCAKALTNLGYTVETSVFSSYGGRVDAETSRRLRTSKYKVIGKYCTQPENLPVDFQQPISGKPIYLKDIDVLVFPMGLRLHGWLKTTDNFPLVSSYTLTIERFYIISSWGT